MSNELIDHLPNKEHDAFEKAVLARARHTPWAVVKPFDFMQEMVSLTPEGSDPNEYAAQIKLVKRPDKPNGYWWTISWAGADSARHKCGGSNLFLALWRAAESEIRARRKAKGFVRKNPKQGVPQGESDT